MYEKVDPHHSPLLVCFLFGSILFLLGGLLRLLGGVLGLFLLLAQVIGQPGEGITRHHQSSGDQGLAAGNVSITPALLVLLPVGRQNVVLALAGHSQGHESQVEDGVLDLLGVLLHDGELVVDFGEAAVGELIGLLDVGRDVAVGTLSVGEDWSDDLAVALVGEFDTLFAVWIVLNGVLGTGDGRVGANVLVR